MSLLLLLRTRAGPITPPQPPVVIGAPRPPALADLRAPARALDGFGRRSADAFNRRRR